MLLVSNCVKAMNIPRKVKKIPIVVKIAAPFDDTVIANLLKNPEDSTLLIP